MKSNFVPTKTKVIYFIIIFKAGCFAIIVLQLYCYYKCSVYLPHAALVCLQYVIVVFLYHTTHLLFEHLVCQYFSPKLILIILCYLRVCAHEKNQHEVTAVQNLKKEKLRLSSKLICKVVDRHFSKTQIMSIRKCALVY